MSTTGTIPHNRLPVEPFLRLVDEWVEKSKGSDLDLCELLWPGVNYDTSANYIWTLRTGSKYVTFDMADRIVCVLAGPDRWHSVPELADIYARVNLLGLDMAYPTCEKALEPIVENVVAARSAGAVWTSIADSLGISANSLKKFRRKHLVLAA